MRDMLVPRIAAEKVQKNRLSDYATRFAFGVGISLVAGVVGMVFGPKVGGVLLGFPAILPASLTLIERKEGKDEASIDSIGACLGAIAMIVFAVFVWLTAARLGPVLSVMIGLAIWLAVAVGLYAVLVLVFKREPRPS